MKSSASKLFSGSPSSSVVNFSPPLTPFSSPASGDEKPIFIISLRKPKYKDSAKLRKSDPEKFNLPVSMAPIVLVRPETGEPVSIMSGTGITNMRTGAAGGIAAKYLAREDSDLIGMIGTGDQARTQLLALDVVLDFGRVKIFSINNEQKERFASSMSEKLGVEVETVSSGKKAVENVDILITTTPSKSPIVFNDWISEGTHINAIGADSKGKEELDPQILKRSKVIVDDGDQACNGGEIHIPLSENKFSREKIHAEIGEIIAGKRVGRESKNEVTVFDSTGMAVQDIATAWLVFNKAKEEGVGKELALF